MNVYRSSDQDWKDLVVRFAGDRKICNCGNAYLTNCGSASIYDSELGAYKKVEDYPTCYAGCSANQIFCKHEIATHVVSLIGRE